MNRAMLIGRLTKDVVTNDGNSRASFTVAINGYGDHVDYINVVAWKKTAEIAVKYLNKGDRVGIVGRITTRTYDTANGEKRTVTEVTADELEFLEPKPKSEPREELALERADDEELPF